MKGTIISKEFQKIEWLQDKNGKQYACYCDDVKDKDNITAQEKQKCLDLSLVAGDSW